MTESPESIVVIGGGLAGGKAVEALRDQGYEGTLTLVAGEDELPYERPPLSKDYLMGKASFDDALVHSEFWYEEHDVDLRRGVRVTALDTEAHEITLSDDSTLPYARLLLATGSDARLLDVPGSVAEGVLYLRTHADSDTVRDTFGAERIVVIGGGWIGLEVAAAARAAGTPVTLVCDTEVPLAHVLGHQIGAVFAHLHRDNDVDLRLGLQVTRITSENGHVTGVELSDQSSVPTSTVIVGIGATPNFELAMEAGLDVDNGILVDAALRTSDPDVWAVGDVANEDHPLFGRIRVEHWANAQNQPAVAASGMLGEDATYDALPYFFSDQYDLGMEYSGYAPAGSYTQVVVRGDLERREFVAFWLDEQSRIKAAMNVNVWDVLDEIKPLIIEGREIDPERLANPNIAYDAL